MADVFVSYNSDDGNAARAFVQKLREKDLEVCFDQDWNGLGEPVSELIEKGLKNSKALVVLLGRKMGPWQNLEVEAGIRRYVYKGRPLFPVLLRGARAKNIPTLLSGLLYLDLTNSEPDDDARLDRLVFAIRSRTALGLNDHVRELHMLERDFLQILLKNFSLLAKNGGLHLLVEFDHRTPSIDSREARRFVRTSNPHFEQQAEQIQKMIENVYNGERHAYEFSHSNFVFRYASGGAVPILNIDGTEYYCLFLRALKPVGWNLANGGCNSIEELLNPTRTIVRELQEELIIRDSKHLYVFDAQGQYMLDRPEFAVARDYWDRWYDEQGLRKFKQLERRMINFPTPEGPDTLTVKYLNENPLTYDSLYVSITTDDYGIEVDRVLVLPLADEGLVLCDGEINAAHSVNRPIGLFPVDGFDFSSHRHVPEFFFYRAKRYKGQEFDDLVRDLVIPDMKASDPSLAQHVIPEFKRAGRTGFGLCPVALQLIRRVADARGTSESG